MGPVHLMGRQRRNPPERLRATVSNRAKTDHWPLGNRGLVTRECQVSRARSVRQRMRKVLCIWQDSFQKAMEKCLVAGG